MPTAAQPPPVPTLVALLLTAAMAAACSAQAPGLQRRDGNGGQHTPQPAFPSNGQPVGWAVRNWADVSQEPPPGARWTLTNGTLTAGSPRGTWLISEAEYGDFILDCEFRLGERGNAGFAFHFPPQGDPSTTGLEVQWVDPRYFGTNYQARGWDLSGAIFRALAPSTSAYRPSEWNRCQVSCIGPSLTVELNGRTVIRTDLDTQTSVPAQGLPLAQRPRRGRIGFQEISRGPEGLQIRNVRLRVPPPQSARSAK